MSALRAVATALPVRLKRVAQIKLLRKKSAARRIATMAVAGVFAGIIGMVVVSLAAAMALYGVAGAISAGLDVPIWGGMAITGFGVLIAFTTVAIIGWRRYAEGRREATRKAIEGIGLSHTPVPSADTQGAGAP